MAKDWGGVVAAIEYAIKSYGPMTKAEIGQHLGLGRDVVSSIIGRMNRPGKVVPKRVYVVKYVYDMEGQRRYPRGVYDLGDKPDAVKPNAKSRAHLREIKRRYYAKRRAIAQNNSVFNLARPIRAAFEKEAA